MKKLTLSLMLFASLFLSPAAKAGKDFDPKTCWDNPTFFNGHFEVTVDSNLLSKPQLLQLLYEFNNVARPAVAMDYPLITKDGKIGVVLVPSTSVEGGTDETYAEYLAKQQSHTKINEWISQISRRPEISEVQCSVKMRPRPTMGGGN